MPRPTYDPVEARLIAARVAIMRTDPQLADVLCRYVFEEGFNVATLARNRTRILYNRSFVRDATDVQLELFLVGIARRAPG
jgi:hypothetical protein